MVKPDFFVEEEELITARKRSLGQGNIFTPVCHSVHRGACVVAGGVRGSGGGACVVAGGCAWLPGGMCGSRGIFK